MVFCTHSAEFRLPLKMQIIREIENTVPGSLRDFSNFLVSGGRISKLTDSSFSKLLILFDDSFTIFSLMLH